MVSSLNAALTSLHFFNCFTTTVFYVLARLSEISITLFGFFSAFQLCARSPSLSLSLFLARSATLTPLLDSFFTSPPLTLAYQFTLPHTISLSSFQIQTHLIRMKFKRPTKSSPTRQNKHTKHRVPKCRLTICLQGLIIVKYG